MYVVKFSDGQFWYTNPQQNCCYNSVRCQNCRRPSLGRVPDKARRRRMLLGQSICAILLIPLDVVTTNLNQNNSHCGILTKKQTNKHNFPVNKMNNVFKQEQTFAHRLSVCIFIDGASAQKIRYIEIIIINVLNKNKYIIVTISSHSHTGRYILQQCILHNLYPDVFIKQNTIT